MQIILEYKRDKFHMGSNPVIDFLHNLGIQYKIIDHPPVFTVEEAKRHRQGMKDATHAKNLFLKDSKENRLYLVSLQADREIRLKSLRKLIGAKKLSFASPDRLLDILGIEPGSVSPFGLLNDVDNEVIYVIDKILWDADLVAYHPNVNNKTLVISGIEFQNIIKELGYKPIILNLEDISSKGK